MANERIYNDVDALTVNSVEVGGVTSINLVQDYVHTVRSEPIGYGSAGPQGPEAIDYSGQRTTLAITTTDVIHMVSLLISTPGSAVWYGHESGTATYGKTTVGAGGNSDVVFHQASLALSRDAYAVLTENAIVRALGTESWETYVNYEAAQAAPTLLAAARLWKPTAVTMNNIAVGHVMSMNLNITGSLLTDYGDADVGVSAVDIQGWSVTGNLVCRQQKMKTATVYDTATEQMIAAYAATNAIAITLEGVGEQGSQVLTVRNTKLLTHQRTSGLDFTQNSFDFECQWRDYGGTARTLVEGATSMVDFA